jgi:uracil-DNA glycosylase
LRTYLARVAAREPGVALVGEAPGYRGCAVTGIPFTSRQVLAEVLTQMLARGSGVGPAGYVAHEGLGRPWAEATATLVWRHLPSGLLAPPLTWNAYPFHPHPVGDAMGNRRLTAAEVAEGGAYLRLALDLFPGVRPIAVGRVAAQALARLGVAPLAVLRHPAHGGAGTFAAGLGAALATM